MKLNETKTLNYTVNFKFKASNIVSNAKSKVYNLITLLEILNVNAFIINIYSWYKKNIKDWNISCIAESFFYNINYVVNKLSDSNRETKLVKMEV